MRSPLKQFQKERKKELLNGLKEQFHERNMEMRRYRISTEKVRKRLDGSFIYSLDDGDVTIACRDREVSIFQNGNAVRMPLGQLKWLLEMCDEHYDNIKFAVEMYMRANRDEIGTIE